MFLQGILDVLGLQSGLYHTAILELVILDLLLTLFDLLWRLFLWGQSILDLLRVLEDAVRDFFRLRGQVEIAVELRRHVRLDGVELRLIVQGHPCQEELVGLFGVAWWADGSQVVDLVGAVLAQRRNVVELEFESELLTTDCAGTPLLLPDGLADVVRDLQTTADAEGVQHPEGVHGLALSVVDQLQMCDLGEGHTGILEAQGVVGDNSDSDLDLLY